MLLQGTRAEAGALFAAAEIAIVIPALDEEASVAAVVREMVQSGLAGAVLVADNGSKDATAVRAREAGALVVHEARRGYGAACLAGVAALPESCRVVVFVDADGSDDPGDLAAVLAPILAGEADLVIGSRVLGRIDPGAMTWPQRLGNWLAPALIRVLWGARFTDLGPFRAIRRDALDRLHMQDRDFGWTVEMQVKAGKLSLRCVEVPVRYRKRMMGVSKISGNLGGVLRAGRKILYIIAREAWHP